MSKRSVLRCLRIVFIPSRGSALKRVTLKRFRSSNAGHLLEKTFPGIQTFPVGIQTPRYVSPPKKQVCGVGFDICGVLMRGKNVMPGARKALKKVKSLNIPFVFLTNGSGGGSSENEKALALSKDLGMEICPEQVVLSHSPMRNFLPEFKNEKILIIGAGSLSNIVKDYGFTNAITETSLLEETKNFENYNDKIRGIFVMNDPRGWENSFHSIINILQDDIQNGRSQTPIYFSTPDMVWSSEYSLPRFGQGSFRKCLEGLYHNLTGKTLKYEEFGKPSKRMYNFARKRLESLASAKGQQVYRCYGIGDNIATDIVGANTSGWESVWCKGDIKSAGIEAENGMHLPKHTATNVLSAVNLVLKNELV